MEAAKGLQMAQAAKLLDYKKDVDEKLVAIEKQIFELEEAYYNETPTGNVMKGWGEFLDAKPGVSGPPKRKMEDESRMFSYSSWTFWTDSPLMKSNRPEADSGANQSMVTDKRSHKKSVSRESSRTDLNADAEQPVSAKNKTGRETGRKKKRRRKAGADDDDD